MSAATIFGFGQLLCTITLPGMGAEVPKKELISSRLLRSMGIENFTCTRCFERCYCGWGAFAQHQEKCMAKGRDSQKSAKKKPEKTLKEKRADKKDKREAQGQKTKFPV
ncbi:MAG: hypothetical protein DHS20C11_35900 [Lysobacteraceae bacterium]|nr:MAG: hypothetical protein DHS20C11_35900 [Xanthomonadaceae bacterium]